ncbi:Sec1 family protein [Entamoeba histolytica HM-1:IMSS-B]|uniref:Sec1 family protein n=7 Tax=Entamoeba TaxID=5758 RepID=A0A8U0WP25_ENTH1|nr:Sec1 family protein [Entamoeba histolytica HM-1:IMSS]EMD44326.1 EhSly1, putative [Entamoeba histolytica KU27]EMH74763.1 Sec1 family protein [Entamoeba histolytica HM-1:IMSS-B]EMS15914.1 EhSly1, putative [Entamoeba histolytica HM-3:IMSS]ENY61401.1 EhSly1, putative [Entamoeba histolytica HM-1:IMSS-A]BAE94830.1 EhSly1 [Entamoeba histolytica]|eukprot:XP_650319.1 Sec1 family protein [Entamoeba histolytica HM-1:IMSS]
MEYKGVLELQTKQQNILTSMLRLNQNDILNNNEEELFWKVIIFDQFNSDLLSLQLRVGDVRKYGVTLMLNIKQTRQVLDDVPAIYFVEATKENLDQIIDDMKSRMYLNFTICFSSRISSELLQYFANCCLENKVEKMIYKIEDLYVNYHVLEPQLFTLSMSNSYQQFNDPQIKEENALKLIDNVTNSLMSICITLKEIPIIRARNGSLEDVIAKELTQKLNLFNTQNPTFFQRGVSTRPLMLITNRNHDISAGLLHGWNYQALIKEVIEYKMNRVKINDHWEDIDITSDFWNECKNKIIPDVTDVIQNKTKELITEKEKFQVVANSFGINFDENVEVNLNEEEKKVLQSEGMMKYGEKMTEIRQLKKEIDLHTTIAREIVENIKKREIDLLFSYEDNVMSQIPVDPTALNLFIERIQNENDLIRLFYIYLLNSNESNVLQKVLEQKNIPLKALNYMKKLKQTQEYLRLTKEKKKEVGFAGMMSDMFGKVVERLLPSDKNMAVTVLVDTITECKKSELESEYNYYDPKISISNILDNRRSIQFKDSIVFVIGGGNYTEYSNIQQYADRNGKRIIYGATELMNGEQLLSQINSFV